jgi:RNA polymerase sigma-70 factor (ECF subfamily)
MDIELSDADLVRRIGAGEREAEAELFRRMAPRIRLYGLRHLRDAHAAEDLTQNVLITIIEALRRSSLREPEKLASFVLGTCRMTILDLRRSAQRKERLLEQFGRDLFRPAESFTPRLDQERLTRCLENLKERERTVVVMTFYDENTSADAAGFLGVSEANVRVIRHRAIRQLRDCMGGQHER